MSRINIPMPSVMQLLLMGAVSYAAFTLYTKKKSNEPAPLTPAQSQVIAPVDNAANRAELAVDLAKYNQQMMSGTLPGMYGNLFGGGQYA